MLSSLILPDEMKLKASFSLLLKPKTFSLVYTMYAALRHILLPSVVEDCALGANCMNLGSFVFSLCYRGIENPAYKLRSLLPTVIVRRWSTLLSFIWL